MPDPWTWDDVRLFLAAWRARSLTGAARALGIHQSSASRRLAALEEAVGARLFDRGRDGLEPTGIGASAVGAAEAAERAMNEFGRALAGTEVTERGTVRLAVPDGLDTLWIAPHLPAFRRAHPHIALELIASAAVANLARREADLALRFARPDAGDLVTRRLLHFANGVWGVPERVADGGPWIDWDEGAAAPEARWVADHVRPAEVVLRTNRVEVKLAAARAGVGLAVLPDALAAREPTLSRLPVDVPGCDLWLVAHRGLHRVPRVRAVWAFAERIAAAERGDQT
ncbi:MAG: LysR family transcriptional regulator [Myxococcota bacterium]